MADMAGVICGALHRYVWASRAFHWERSVVVLSSVNSASEESGGLRGRGAPQKQRGHHLDTGGRRDYDLGKVLRRS